MLKFPFLSLLSLTLSLATVSATGAVEEEGDAGFLKAQNARADALYINAAIDPAARDYRKMYIAPVNLAKMQIIQPEGVAADDEWAFTDVEDAVLQNAMLREFATQLSFQSAFYVVEQRDEADMVLHTTVVAVHPNAGKSEMAKQGRTGGAITISLALVDEKSGQVMVRSVDTKSTDDIWAFNDVESDDPAVNLLFRSWGNSMRRGLLALQGRSNDPLTQTLEVAPQ